MGKIYKLSEYNVPTFWITHIDLTIDLTESPIKTKSILTIKSNPANQNPDLVLDGRNMKLLSVILDENQLFSGEYEVGEDTLTIRNVPLDKTFTLETSTLLGENTDLFGIYKAGDIYLAKAETIGFSKIAYSDDRPDNPATYTTTIIADEQAYPKLLSNGKIIKRSELPNDKHSVTWSDTVPKPTYLFAMVAGDLKYSPTTYKTKSGREISIVFYVPEDATTKCEFAKEVLKKAMRWDEDQFQLECKLQLHMIAGVDKYASGASEPTGLNLFNTANLYATPARNTDLEILRVLDVVAHEFLHYWSGNMVTIRDWFNLSLKEGLTTFRTNMFREELFGTDLVRLLDGKNLDERAPRQDSYTAVRSLYTAAAYEKSADIFRMMMLSIGRDKFYPALTQFFKDNEGGAVTLEHLFDSLTKNTGYNAQIFLPWFTESGIPRLSITDEYNAETQIYTLKVNTADGKERPIPLVMGLLNDSGEEIISDKLLMIDQSEFEIRFTDIESRPIPSLLRSFSAPVYLDYNYSSDDLLLLIKHDTNHYNRSEAAKKLITRMVADYCSGKDMGLTPRFYDTYRALLTDKSISQWMIAELMTLPSEEELIANIKVPNFEKIAEARRIIQSNLAERLKTDLYNCYDKLQNEPKIKKSQFSIFDIKEAGNRRLKTVCYSYIQHLNNKNTITYLSNQFRDSLSLNMTQTTDALRLLCSMNAPNIDELLNEFYQEWENDTSAVNAWLKIQAAAHFDNSVERVSALLEHPSFDLSNPNNVYALLGTFTRNPYGFHKSSGDGYKLITDAILKLDKINPPVAAHLTEAYTNWEHYDPRRQFRMLDQLQTICDKAVSEDVKNIAKKGLDKTQGSSPLPLEMMFLGSGIKTKAEPASVNSSIPAPNN